MVNSVLRPRSGSRFHSVRCSTQYHRLLGPSAPQIDSRQKLAHIRKGVSILRTQLSILLVHPSQGLEILSHS